MQFRRSSRASSEPRDWLCADLGSHRRFRQSIYDIQSSTDGCIPATVRHLNLQTGCYVPLRTSATPANCLPDLFRTPSAQGPMGQRSEPGGAWSCRSHSDYSLGPDDELNVIVRGLSDADEIVIRCWSK